VPCPITSKGAPGHAHCKVRELTYSVDHIQGPYKNCECLVGADIFDAVDYLYWTDVESEFWAATLAPPAPTETPKVTCDPSRRVPLEKNVWQSCVSPATSVPYSH
jgi:hypothetical protein